jgi:cell division protein FtsB
VAQIACLQSVVAALEREMAELAAKNEMLMERNEKLMERLKKAEETVVDLSRLSLKGFELYKNAEAWLEEGTHRHD